MWVQDISSYKPDFADKLGPQLGDCKRQCREKMIEIEKRYTDYAAMRTWLYFLKMDVSEVNSWIDNDAKEWRKVRMIFNRLERVGRDLEKMYGRKVYVIYGVRLK